QGRAEHDRANVEELRLRSTPMAKSVAGARGEAGAVARAHLKALAAFRSDACGRLPGNAAGGARGRRWCSRGKELLRKLLVHGGDRRGDVPRDQVRKGGGEARVARRRARSDAGYASNRAVCRAQRRGVLNARDPVIEMAELQARLVDLKCQVRA